MNKHPHELIATFPVFLSPSPDIFSFWPKRMDIYSDRLVIQKNPPLAIQYTDIKSIELKNGQIHIRYPAEILNFIIPSTVKGITDSATTDLFIELIENLMERNFLPEIVDAIQKATKHKKQKTQLVDGLLVLSVVLFGAAFLALNSNRPYLILFFIWPMLACLLATLAVSLLRSRRDFIFHYKLTNISSHYHMADRLLSSLENDSSEPDEEKRIYYLGKAMIHLEKIIELDPASPYILEIRKRMFPEKYGHVESSLLDD
jgi:hypothetical protein